MMVLAVLVVVGIGLGVLLVCDLAACMLSSTISREEEKGHDADADD